MNLPSIPSTMFNLTGKTALVTGAAHGIGEGIALALAEHGADIVLVDIRPIEETKAVASKITQLGRQAWVYQQDIAEIEALSDLADSVWTQAGKIDILVNNAGIAVLNHFHEVDLATWRRIMTINVEAMFFLTQAIALKMIAAGIKGRIINLSSKNGLVAEPGLVIYNTSKGAVELLTQSLATELGIYGITVNALAPGSTPTTIGKTDPTKERPVSLDFLAYRHAHTPLENRDARIEEIAAGAVFLASPGASFMTGQHLVIDGGVLAQQMPRLQFMKPSGLGPA